MGSIFKTEILGDINIRKKALAEAGNHKNVIYPAIYKHFKHEETGIINNYLYATMFISKPIMEYQSIRNDLFNTVGVNIIEVQLTEDENTTILFEKDCQYYHDIKDCDEDLVIYKSLYDCSRFPYARPLSMFTEKCSKEQYEKYGQKYRFEQIE